LLVQDYKLTNAVVAELARQRGAAERADAAAEQRADVGRTKPGKGGVGDAVVLGIWRMLLP
jgi:hypothetical protein